MVDVGDLAPEQARPIFRAEYDKLVELGMFDDERLELLEGVIVTRSPQGARHAAVIRKLNQALTLALTGRAFVQVQSPLALDDRSEPEPDVAVVPLGDYDRALPASASLVVEVSDASLRKDRLVKARMYASAAIAEYWIVNLENDVVEVRRDPQRGVYTTTHERRRGEQLSLLAFPDVELAVDDFLPR